MTASEYVHGPDDGPLHERISTLPEGSVLKLDAGQYRGPIALINDITIEAAGDVGSVVITSTGGPTVRMEGASNVILRRLVLKGPTRGFGAVIAAWNPAQTRIEDCLLNAGRGEGEGGGAIDIQAGRIAIVRCRVTESAALQGGAVRVAGPALVEASSSVFSENVAEGQGGGAIFANRGGTALLEGCTFDGNRGDHGSALLAARGGTGGTIRAKNCLFGSRQEGLAVAVHEGGTLSLRHCAIAAMAESVSEGVQVDATVVEKSVPLRREPPRYRPEFPTQLRDLGCPSDNEDAALDVYGQPRGSLAVGAVGDL